jgi:hypothetical protein
VDRAEREGKIMKIYCTMFPPDPNHLEEGRYVRVLIYNQDDVDASQSISIAENEFPRGFDFFASLQKF